MQRVLFLSGRTGGGPRAAAAATAHATRAAVVSWLAIPLASAAVADGNFRVVGVAADRAAAIVTAAEEARSTAFTTLLDQPAPAAWRVRCEVHVHHDPGAFAAAVGGPPAAARGATSIEFGETDVLLRRIDVMGDGSAVVPDALAHEIVHVVLADHFVAEPPPRWADEGLAVLFDAADIQRRHDADFRTGQGHGLGWSARDLLMLDELPSGTPRQRVFYGQSAAVVRWLVARRDPATFIRFLNDSAVRGTEAALQAHYDLDSIAALEQAWREVPAFTLLGMTSPNRQSGE